MEILAIIPARGGSKGLPRKNVLPLAGHPLIAWSVAAAVQCPAIRRTIVSTDDAEIGQEATRYGAQMPFVRPAQFAQDLSTDLEVFQHALRWLADHEGYVPDLVVQLRPTSPLRRMADLEACIARMQVREVADSLRIITEAPATPYKMWTLPDGEEGEMSPLLSLPGVAEPYNEPRQRLPKVYWQIGLLDVIRPAAILGGSMSGNTILPYLVPSHDAIDIDEIESFAKAERILAEFPGRYITPIIPTTRK